MQQSSVAGSKRRPTLSLQPPKLKPPQQITKHREADLPRTPYPVLSKGGKRSVSFSEQDDSPREGEAKKRKIAREGGILSTPPYLANFPSPESRYPPASQYRVIPPVELMKAWESILDQVDWSEVVQEAGGREKPDAYRNVFKTIVHSHIEELLKQEEYGKDMKIEFGERDADTESGNDSSEEGGGDGFRYFEDNTFLESDESGLGSEDYTDDETDDEENSDDEDQEDDDCEGIDNLASV